jgi:hypothetical protein
MRGARAGIPARAGTRRLGTFSGDPIRWAEMKGECMR